MGDILWLRCYPFSWLELRKKHFLEIIQFLLINFLNLRMLIDPHFFANRVHETFDGFYREKCTLATLLNENSMVKLVF